MEQLLERHFAGASSRELAVEEGCSHETVAKEIRDLKREHATKLAGMLLVARKQGEVMWLAIPSTSGADVASWLRYMAWAIDELESLSFSVKVSFQMKADGVVIGLEDVDALEATA